MQALAATLTPHKVFNDDFFLYDQEGKRFIQIRNGFVFGRTEGDQKFPTDPGLSGKHCQILIEGTDIYVRDLNSRNRTWINGEPVPSGLKQKLRLNDLLNIGHQKLVLTNRKKDAPVPSERTGFTMRMERSKPEARFDQFRKWMQPSYWLTFAIGLSAHYIWVNYLRH